MAAGESTQGDYGDVLLAIVARLIEQVKGCNESTCYLAIDPDSLPSNPGTHVVVVSPLSGDFTEGTYVGGGLDQLLSEGGLIVKVHLPSMLDEQGRDVQALTSESLGLIRKANAVIAAISEPSWQPQTGGATLTREPLTPAGYAFTKSHEGSVRAIELRFKCRFDWSTEKK